MALLGITGISLVETITPAFIVFLSIVAVVSLLVNLRKMQVAPKRLWSVIAFAILIFFLADYLLISMNLLVSAARFLSVLMVSKLFDLRTNRDYIITYTLVFFLILAAAASTASIMFLGILALFLVSGIWAMIIFNIKRDWAIANPLSVEDPPGRLFSRRFFVFVIVTSLFSLVFTFALFFTIPRAGLGFLERKTSNTVKVTGFSDTVDLGDIGAVLTDRTIVMRVGIKSGQPPGLIHFRGSSLDHYDGRKWTRLAKKNIPVTKDRAGRFFIGYSQGRLLEQEILLEPLDTDVLIAASNVMYINGRIPSMRMDSSGTLYLPAPPYSRIEYTAWSDTLHPRGDSGFEAAAEEFRETSFLDIDPSGPAIRALTKEVTRHAKDDNARAAALEAYLKTAYEYTLDPPHTEGKTPLEDFLFYSKKGYCEHYASAMVVMLRGAGIPSRLVTGFLQGEWNSYGSYFIVRQENAHSWVEAYIKGRGWMTFDPTPGSGADMFNMPSAFSQYIDFIKWKWNRNIVHFTLFDQVKMAVSFENSLHSYFSALKKAFAFTWNKDTASKDRKVLPQYWLIAVIIAIAALIIIILRKRSSAHKLAIKTPWYYSEMIRILKGKGIERQAAETPAEFAKRLNAPAVYAITRCHEAQRYGARAPEQAELARLENDLEEIRKSDTIRKEPSRNEGKAKTV